MGWPSFLHRLDCGIYSQIACRKARPAGYKGKVGGHGARKPIICSTSWHLDPGLADARLIPPGPWREHRFGAKPYVFL
eukprot:14008818-Heterocapsa_arctica.AAC.1